MRTDRTARAVWPVGRVVAVVGSVLTTVAGCGLWAGPDVPDDFTTTEVETIEVSHPPGWDTYNPKDEDGAPQDEDGAPQDEDGAPQDEDGAPQDEDDASDETVTALDLVHEEEDVEVARVSVVHQMIHGRSPEFAVGVAVRQRNGVLPRYQDERAEVFNTGAEAAYRVDFSFEDPDGEVTGVEGATTKGIDIVMVGHDHYGHHVAVSWDPDRFDTETAEKIAETVYLHD